MPSIQHKDLKVGNYVVVVYEGEFFPGKITRKKSNGAEVKCMQKCEKFWKWPTRKDEMFYFRKDITMKIATPKKVKKNVFAIPELEKRWK